jgi:hypothetical protein
LPVHECARLQDLFSMPNASQAAARPAAAVAQYSAASPFLAAGTAAGHGVDTLFAALPPGAGSKPHDATPHDGATHAAMLAAVPQHTYVAADWGIASAAHGAQQQQQQQQAWPHAPTAASERGVNPFAAPLTTHAPPQQLQQQQPDPFAALRF